MNEYNQQDVSGSKEGMGKFLVIIKNNVCVNE
jgi:hypothetical protein